MPRQARFVLPGYLHHITQRGNYQQQIFQDNADRIYYLKLIQHYANEYGNDIFAFCLMSNHVHFIIRPQSHNSLAGIFCRAHQRYALYYHKKNKLAGHLWQERFYSCLLEGSHIPAAIRYVEQNPVRANIVDHAWDYSWSSAKAHLGKHYNIIEIADIKEYFTQPDWKKFLGYQEKDEHLIRQLKQATETGTVFGTTAFIQDLENIYNRPLTPRKRGGQFKQVK